MNRRHFLSATAVTTATVTAAIHSRAADAESAGTREYYELRRYHLRRGPRQRGFSDYLRQALLPALKRAGLGPIGAFQIAIGPESPSIYLLIPFRDLQQFAALPEKLRNDAEYREAAAPTAEAPPSDPAYLRAESSLMIAFAGMPKLEVPSQTRDSKPRLFELRTYESHNKRANLKKIEMFNHGEIAIFRRTGLTPVFFGETLIGSRLPNLTYLLVFDDMAAREQAWRTFGGDPEWRKLSGTAGYTDAEIVADISNLLLRPTDFSQI
jgi:hypothetical protein